MIDSQTAEKIRRETQDFWDNEVRKPYFVETAQGKEIGHRIADLVDDKTTGLLAVNHITKYQRDSRGNRLPRSMGDIWLEHDGIYHPINVKAGVSSANGQPNMVSLKKLLDALLRRQIDAYYLLMVKLEIRQSIRCVVHFVDMLDYLDYVTFDSGPGQIMLRAKAFFSARSEGIVPPQRSIGDKVARLLDLLEDGERRLAENRKTALAEYRRRVKEYSTTKRYVVTPDTQASLNLR